MKNICSNGLGTRGWEGFWKKGELNHVRLETSSDNCHSNQRHPLSSSFSLGFFSLLSSRSQCFPYLHLSNFRCFCPHFFLSLSPPDLLSNIHTPSEAITLIFHFLCRLGMHVHAWVCVRAFQGQRFGPSSRNTTKSRVLKCYVNLKSPIEPVSSFWACGR